MSEQLLKLVQKQALNYLNSDDYESFHSHQTPQGGSGTQSNNPNSTKDSLPKGRVLLMLGIFSSR